MRRIVLVISLTVLAHVSVSVFGAADRGDQEKKVDKTIDRALVFLKNHQQPDGTWYGGNRGGARDPSITALAVMAFLSAGHLPGEGPYGPTVDKGVRAVLKFQNAKSGLISTSPGWEMYQHGICTLMLAEVAGMTADRALGKKIHDKLTKAIDLIVRSQRKPDTRSHRGGWRYRAGGKDSDMSVTGWQIMALRAAKNVGCDVPSDSIERAVDYIKRSQDPGSGGFAYMTEGRGVTLPCTGTGILALEICGKGFHRSREAKKAGSHLLKNMKNWPEAHFSYGIYYCSQAMFQLGDNYWKAFRPFLHQRLLGSQQVNGSWLCKENFGPNYSTSMAVLALTVEYRYLPIYQRDEEQERAN